MDKEYADKALGVQAELTRHGFQTSLSGIHVMISSETRKAFCAHVYIEQNQGSAGVVGARFSARVFGDEAWAQASLGSPFLADTNENTVVGNIMITSNSPVLRDTIADYLNGVPRDPTPDLEEKDNFLNEELERKLQEVYLWDDYHKNSTVRFLARDFAALWDGRLRRCSDFLSKASGLCCFPPRRQPSSFTSLTIGTLTQIPVPARKTACA